MSSMYRIGVQIYGSASGYVGAVNTTLRATTRLGQGFKTAATHSRLLDNQIKAIGTTARYAFAGALVFGITAAIGRLQDFENQLGTIDSLAGQLDSRGQFKGLGSSLDDLGSDAIKLSDRFGQSVTDVETYMARFASTFNRRPGESIAQYRSDLDSFTGSILQLQAALGSEAGDPSALAGGIGGLINAIPGGRQNIAGNTKRIGNLIAYLTQVTPNFSGTDVANASGRLASVVNTSGMTPEQMFAILGQAAKSGGSPSIVVRGVQQLLGQSLLTPKSPGAKASYQRVFGTSDPTTLRNIGGFNVLERLMEAVAPGGLKLSRSQRAAVNNATTAQQLQGALPGLNLTELMSFFGRIQSVQQFVNILSQGGVKGLQDYIRSQKIATEANLLRARSESALNRQGLQIARNAFANISLSLVRGLNGPFTILGHAAQHVSDLLAGHRTTVKGLETAGATGLIGRAIAGTSIGQRIPGLRALGGLGKLEQKAAGAAIMAEESPAVASGLVADGSRASPFWVIISPYSWQFGYGGLSQPANTKSTENKVLNYIKKGVATGGAGALGARTAATLSIGAAALPATATGVAAYEAFKHNPKLDPRTVQRAQQSYALSLLKDRMRAEGKTKIEFGTAKADITMHLVDKNGNEILTQKKKGVPIGVPHTKDTAPQSGGRTGVKKGK